MPPKVQKPLGRPPLTSRDPHAVDVLIGSRIRAFRLDLGMTMEDVAERIGVTHQQVQKYEAGKNRITGGKLQQIADVLGRPVECLFSPSGDAVPMPATRFEKTILRLSQTVPPIHQQLAVLLLSSLGSA